MNQKIINDLFACRKFVVAAKHLKKKVIPSYSEKLLVSIGK